ncbi:creatininase family protein [[Clostridium] polysaccharolyticum]|nr:creatininase family protein [[Clostridium] polysaccharolyticum]
MTYINTQKYSDRIHTEVEACLHHNWLVIPVGSVEQHGINLPLSVDYDIAHAVAEWLCEEAGYVLAPGLTYGARSLSNSGGGDRFKGNVYLDGGIYIKVVQNILTRFIENGAKRILLLNGHYENYAFLCEAAQKADYLKNCNIVVINWWDILTDDYMIKQTKGRFCNWEEEHAGIVETALEMYLNPSSVKGKMCIEEDGVYKGIYSSHIDCVNSKTGALSSNIGATEEMGEQLFIKIVEEIRKLTKTFLELERKDNHGNV